MTRTLFAPQRQGFSFSNYFTLDEDERLQLQELYISYFIQRRTLGRLGAVVAPRLVRMVRPKLERSLSPVYGLCGGMVFTSLDLHYAGLPIPSGLILAQPPASGTPLRRYIWRRQLDSLVSNGSRFVAWPFTLNYVPNLGPFRGKTRALLGRSRREWQKLKAKLNSGDPVPIGLVRGVKEMFQNHQVLALGYEEVDAVHGVIYVYDPNCPANESLIHLTFGERALEGRESCAPNGPPVRGFFCETYRPADPTEVAGSAA